MQSFYLIFFVGGPSYSLWPACFHTTKFNTPPFNSLSTSKKFMIWTVKIWHLVYLGFIFPHSCSFTILEASCCENLAKLCQVNDFASMVPCKWKCHIFEAHKFFKTQFKTWQYVNQKTERTKRIWIATPNAKWTPTSKALQNCVQVSYWLQLTLASWNPSDWHHLYKCKDVCLGNGQPNQRDKN